MVSSFSCLTSPHYSQNKLTINSVVSHGARCLLIFQFCSFSDAILLCSVLPENPRSAITRYFLSCALLIMGRYASAKRKMILPKNAMSPMPTPKLQAPSFWLNMQTTCDDVLSFTYPSAVMVAKTTMANT